MKKIWSILMAAIILCLAVSVPSLAKGTPTLELRPSASSIQPGGEFTVELVIHNNPGIAGIRFAFQYDETLLQLTDANGQSVTDWEVGIKAKQDETGEKVDRENAVWAQGENWTGSDCCILRLTFRVLENAPMDTVTTIGITGLDIMNASLQEVPFTATSATVTIQEEPPGVTVSGTVTSYGDAAEKVTVTLLQGETSVGTWSGTTGHYTISNVPPGTYNLRVEKKNHVTRDYTVKVGTEDVTQKVRIFLLGDVNEDGRVNIQDVIRLLNHVNNSSPFVDAHHCDINNDSRVNIQDVIRLLNHVNNSSKLY